MKSSTKLLVVNILIVFGFSLTTSAQTEIVPSRVGQTQSYTNQPLRYDGEGPNSYAAPRDSVPILSGQSDLRVSPAEVIPGDGRIVTNAPLSGETIERTPSTSDLEMLSREREMVGNQNDDRLGSVNRSRDRDQDRGRH